MNNYDEEYEDDDFLSEYNLPTESELTPEKRVVLQILDVGGNIEDIMFDIEEIYNYVKKLYENCPERG